MVDGAVKGLNRNLRAPCWPKSLGPVCFGSAALGRALVAVGDRSRAKPERVPAIKVLGSTCGSQSEATWPREDA